MPSPFPDLPEDELRGFLAAAGERPDDDAVRLVFADWLDDHGDPRADLVRWSVEDSRLGERDPRRAEVRRDLGAWRRQVAPHWPGGLPRRFRVVRGLVVVDLEAGELPRAGEEVTGLSCWRQGWVLGCQISGYQGQDLGGLRRSAVPLGVSGRGLAGLAGLANLFQLELRSDDSAGGLAPLARLPALRSLALATLTDAGAAHLGGLALETLSVARCPALTDAGLDSLAGLGRLTSLSLAGGTFTDAGLGRLLERLPRLHTLTLLDCLHLTDGVLRPLADHPGLRVVQLFCAGITEAGARWLRQALPGCLVAR